MFVQVAVRTLSPTGTYAHIVGMACRKTVRQIAMPPLSTLGNLMPKCLLECVERLEAGSVVTIK